MNYGKIKATGFLCFLLLSVAAAAQSNIYRYDTLQKDAPNRYFKQLDESVLQLYVFDKRLYLINYGLITGLVRFCCGNYALKDNVYQVTADTDAYCRIAELDNHVLHESNRLVPVTFSNVVISKPDDNNMVVGWTEGKEELLPSPELKQIFDSYSHKKSDKAIKYASYPFNGDSIFFPFQCGFLVNVYTCSPKGYTVSVQVNDMGIVYEQLQSVTTHTGLIQQGQFIGIRTKETSVTVFKYGDK